MNIETICPVNTNPYIRCYRVHAYMLNIVGLSNKSFDKYVFTNYLCLHNGKENIRREYLDFHLDNNFLNIKDLYRYNDWFDIFQISRFGSFDKTSCSNLKEIIIDFLKKDYYILHNINEAYLPHSATYGGSDLNNIVLTHGYDKENDTFMLLDYDKTGRFGSSIVKSQDYLNSISMVTVTNRLNFIKSKPNLDFSFDQNKALKLLKCHIESQNAYLDHEDLKNNIFGYEAIERTLNCALKNGINMIRMRVIKEHKEIILKYLMSVFDYNYIDNKNFIIEYKLIVNQMNNIFMRFIKNNMLGINQDIELIDSIRSLNYKELDILSRYLKYCGI